MISKISLGTVQFGQDYGIANTRGRVSEGEVREILDYAKGVGITSLDTAFAYGVSEAVLGKCLKESSGDFKIISKLPPLKEKGSQKVEEFFKESMQRLGVRKIYGYLVHRYTDIFINEDIWKSLIRLKENGQVEKIGFSLYSPEELSSLLERDIDLDIIQVPYSIFDRRFEKYFHVLREKGIEIQARSVFLQGLAFLRAEALPVALQEARPQLEDLKKIAEGQNISIEALCLNFVLLNRDIGKVVIGVDSLAHLKKNVTSVASADSVREVCGRLDEVRIESEDILLPYKWSLKK